MFGSQKNVMSLVKVRAQKTPALHKLNLNLYQESTADRERGGGGGTETNVSFTEESRNEWQLRSNVTSHECDTR